MEAEKVFARALVLGQESVGTQIFSLLLEEKTVAPLAKPGQFVSVYCHDRSRLLPRPISICEADPAAGTVRLVYRIAGEGTREFAALKTGDMVEILGPLGNGFPLEEAEGKRAFLIGGGIGIPPLVELAKRLPGKKQIIAGYRDELFLTQELSRRGELFIATEDGSTGTKGNVLDCIRENGLTADIIFACGPTPMLRALKAYAETEKIPCYLSLEQRMACGIGACLACVCHTTEKDEHSQVKNKRICGEGPVFEAGEIVL